MQQKGNTTAVFPYELAKTDELYSINGTFITIEFKSKLHLISI